MLWSRPLCTATSVFRAARSYTSQVSGRNHDILQMLQKSRDEEYSRPNRNNFKLRAFQNAIQAITATEFEITSGEQARQIKGIGNGIALRISEHFNPISEPEREAHAVKAAILKSFQELPYIGPVKAKQLYETGARSPADLKNEGSKWFKMLTAQQKSAVLHHDHLSEDVPMHNCLAIADFLQACIPSQFSVHLVGGYRRQYPSKTIDILMVHPSAPPIPIPTEPAPFSSPPDYSMPEKEDGSAKPKKGRRSVAFRNSYATAQAKKSSLLLKSVIPLLADKRSDIPEFSVVSTVSESERKWVGVVRLGQKSSNVVRKLNLTLVPPRSFPSALLFLTGGTSFISHLCYRANSMGMLLNEFGLWKWEAIGTSSSSKREPSPSVGATSDAYESGYWSLVKTESEEDIFSELGLDFVHPDRRNWAALDQKKPKPFLSTSRTRQSS